MSRYQPHPEKRLAPYLRFLEHDSGAQRWEMRLYHDPQPRWVPLKVAAQESAERIFFAYDADPATWAERAAKRRAALMPLIYIAEVMCDARRHPKTQRQHVLSAVRSLQDHVGEDVPAGRITSAAVGSWIAAKEASGWMRNTSAGNLKAVRRVYNFAIEEGMLSENPTRATRVSGGPAENRVIVTARQVLRFFDADAPEAHRKLRGTMDQRLFVSHLKREDCAIAEAWCRVSFWLAARPEEIARMRGDGQAIEFTGDRLFVNIIQTKVGGVRKRRPVPVADPGFMLPYIARWVGAPKRYAKAERMTRWLRLEGLRHVGEEVTRADLRSSGITAMCLTQPAHVVARWVGTSVGQIERTYSRPLMSQEAAPKSLLGG